MRHEDDFTKRSTRYKKQYIDAVGGLYGAIPPNVPSKPRKTRKAQRSSGTPTEYSIQAALVQWARLQGLPLISIPNAGKRSYWQGQKEVAAGLLRGVSDLFLPIMRHGLGGMWIELKKKGRKPTQEQSEWLDKMREGGYAAGWYDDWELARNAIVEYLG